MSDNNAILVENVSKSFKLPKDNHNGIKQLLINTITGRRKKGYEKQRVLKNVSFEIQKGEFYGIVGRNGSGKSTLLKLLAQIYTPEKGSVKVNGSLTPFIELGVGFNPELTGRENVYLNGALLGFSKSEVEAMYEDIVSFAELSRFMDQKLKNYSSGMQVRLAFSIAIRAKSDILLLDEVLAVGDEAFQQKCFEYFGELKKQGRTVVLVTHDMSSVERFCTKAMLIEAGKVRAIGSGQKIAAMYSELFSDQQSNEIKSASKTTKLKDNNLSVYVDNIEVYQGGKVVSIVKAYDSFELHITINSQKNNEGVVGLNLVNSQGQLVMHTTTRDYLDQLVINKGKTLVIIEVDNIFTNDLYSIDLAIGMGGGMSDKLVYQSTDIARFMIKGFTKSKHSPTHPGIRFTVN
mgnify:CR=1 FL=1|tara:strand:+ start:2312 stop:3526 length:1215 start_codon:yes stop_codon:yes gene_type:complete